MKAKNILPIIITSIVLLTYINSLFNGFVWLDQAEILNKKLIISNIHDLKQFFLFNDNNYTGYHRPMYNLMHSFDYLLWKENAFGYHLSSVIIHISNTLLIFFISLNISRKRIVSLFIALFFGLLPCHTATVSLIHSKADLLACFFILLSIFILSKDKLNNLKSVKSSKLILGCFLFFLALLSKEVAIMLPFFILAIGYILYHKNMSFTKSVLIYPTILGIIFISFRLCISSSQTSDDSLSFIDRIFTFIPVYVDYIIRTLTSLELTTNDSVMIWSQFNKGIYAIYTITFIGLIAMQYYFSKKNILIAAGFLWFNLFLIPVSQIIPILHFRADRFLYIPSMGLIMSIAFILLYYYKQLNRAKKKSITIGTLCLLLFLSCLRIWNRNKDFSSNQKMFSKVIIDHPQCREAQGIIGNEYLKSQDYQKALLYINKALQKQNAYYSFVDKKSNLGNLGIIYMRQNKINQALEIFLNLKSLENYNPVVLFNIGICYKKIKNYTEAKTYFLEYLQYKPNNVDALFNLGQVGIELGDKEMSRMYFRRYLNNNPSSEFRKTIEDFLQSLEK